MINEATKRMLELDQLLEMAADFTVSPAGRRLVERHGPSRDASRVQAWLEETEEAARLLALGASVPLSAMEGIDLIVSLLGKGKVYAEQELHQLGVWLASVAQMKRYMESKREVAPRIASYADSMDDCPELRKELARCLRGNQLTDESSAELGRIRRQLYALEAKIEKKIEQAMGKYKSALQESIVSKRRGHYVIAVKRELRKQVPGTVWDESASGQTLFVEPVDVAGLQQEWDSWKADEEQECYMIRAQLSAMAEARTTELTWNVDGMGTFDFITARGKLSRTYNGQRPKWSAEPVIKLQGARHPLLPNEQCVPLDVEMGYEWKQLIITGPNTGGKTVALKTAGLLVLLHQAGFLIPAEATSELGLFHCLMADLGDGQNIEQSLSTFSAHMTNVAAMVKAADSRTLLLLDELAAGTDPGEGIALSIAVLEHLLSQEALVAATTHFNEIKRYASQTAGCMNASMTFDPQTLRPLHRLVIGEAGESRAFAVARRFGLPEAIVARAEAMVSNAPQSNERITMVDADSGVARKAIPGNQAKKQARPGQKRNDEEAPTKPKAFQSGDCVWIYPLKRTGIVYQEADERGNVIVQVEQKKLTFNRKRLAPYIDRSKLYPGSDYDMAIVFDSKSDRKKRHLMSRKYVKDVRIENPPDAGE
ncbi:DNA mismatch repair protein MutS domain protein [Paenibacillus curdlanolyticus YK9]|uniref:DNA mismatch repair protein MutS domain protein n=1 Tax=Paenibacillus curdlanolyticus YK9 TaxID=717606 RepID=E0IDT8_9BACL|nr:DNA mismatch repair protein MutS [Paenibacillus curdlanolyticus]EFM09292.1 DNA mismatch repair protein MutS domain protein [Paenibacillus curdlanolyticus YK9]